LPDSQAGYSCSFKLDFFASNDQESNSTDQCQSAKYGGNGNPLMILTRGVDGTEIKNLLLMSVSEALIGQRQPTQNNQENPSPNNRFHILRSCN